MELRDSRAAIRESPAPGTTAIACRYSSCPSHPSRIYYDTTTVALRILRANSARVPETPSIIVGVPPLPPQGDIVRAGRLAVPLLSTFASAVVPVHLPAGVGGARSVRGGRPLLTGRIPPSPTSHAEDISPTPVQFDGVVQSRVIPEPVHPPAARHGIRRDTRSSAWPCLRSKNGGGGGRGRGVKR